MKLESEILQRINSSNIDEYELEKFIRKKITSKFFKKQNKVIIVQLLPKLLESTSSNNKMWLDNLYFMTVNDNFLDILIKNIHKINFNEDTSILDTILKIIEENQPTKEQIISLIDEIIICNITINYSFLDILHTTINHLYPELIDYMVQKYIKNKNTCIATTSLLRVLKKEEIIYENIDIILENANEIDLFSLKDAVKNNKEAKELVDKKIEKSEKEQMTKKITQLYQQFYRIKELKNDEQSQKNFQTIVEVIYLIVKDICKNEQINISDIKYIGRGGFSAVLIIGDKVVKIGQTRLTKTFPNNPYIVASLLRKEFKINESTSIFIEVNERVDTNSKITNEELYQLYKKIRDLHLVWLDVAQKNVGRLLKDNKIYWREDLPITDKVLGLEESRRKEILKKGDIVILDNDAIYDEKILEEKHIHLTDLQEEFEKRYQQEKNQKNENNDSKEENNHKEETKKVTKR